MYELLIAVIPSALTSLVTVLVMKNKNKTNLELAEKDHKREIEKYKVELEKQLSEHNHALELRDKEHQYEMEKIEHQARIESKSSNDNQMTEMVMKLFSGEIDMSKMEELAKQAERSTFNQPPKKPNRRK